MSTLMSDDSFDDFADGIVSDDNGRMPINYAQQHGNFTDVGDNNRQHRLRFSDFVRRHRMVVTSTATMASPVSANDESTSDDSDAESVLELDLLRSFDCSHAAQRHIVDTTISADRVSFSSTGEVPERFTMASNASKTSRTGDRVATKHFVSTERGTEKVLVKEVKCESSSSSLRMTAATTSAASPGVQRPSRPPAVPTLSPKSSKRVRKEIEKQRRKVEKFRKRAAQMAKKHAANNARKTEKKQKRSRRLFGFWKSKTKTAKRTETTTAAMTTQTTTLQAVDMSALMPLSTQFNQLSRLQPPPRPHVTLTTASKTESPERADFAVPLTDAVSTANAAATIAAAAASRSWRSQLRRMDAASW